MNTPCASRSEPGRKSNRTNTAWLHQTVRDEETAANFLREKGLLHRERLCPVCGEAMRLTRRGMAWRCFKRSCRKEVAVRTGTWFDVPRNKVKLQKAVQIIFNWSREYTTSKFCVHELGLGHGTGVLWNGYLRQVTADALAKRPVQLGGPGMTVELDESLFSRRKYNRGKMYSPLWLFGGVCRENGEFHVEPVKDRSANTLLPVVRSRVRPQSAVVTDEWRAYRRLGREGYNHSRVNHSRNFVDRDTGAHTQTIESMWAQLKRGNKRRCGTHRSVVVSYLNEFMWRKRLGPSDAFEAILADIRMLHPPRVDATPAQAALPKRMVNWFFNGSARYARLYAQEEQEAPVNPPPVPAHTPD